MTDNPKTKRCYAHDYREPCIYHITVATEDRKPVLGKLSGDIYTAHIELSPIGVEVRHELYALCDRYPQLRLLQYQIMPDHVHVIIQSTERLPKPVGNLLSSWKIACGQAYGRLSAGASASSHDKADQPIQDSVGPSDDRSASAALSGASALAPAGGSTYRPLFSKGYNDSILYGRGQLQAMMAYVRDNPRRLLIKRAHNSYFAIHRGLDICGHILDAVGNLSLLQRPLLAVHCRRRWTEAEQRAYAKHCIEAASQGTTLIGAFISKPEQAIASAARKKKLPLIYLEENGFPELYKPVGSDFYATAEGRLLQLAPWPYHAANTAINREQCNALNTMAESIAATVNNNYTPR